jgi:hypothetical protein
MAVLGTNGVGNPLRPILGNDILDSVHGVSCYGRDRLGDSGDDLWRGDIHQMQTQIDELKKQVEQLTKDLKQKAHVDLPGTLDKQIRDDFNLKFDALIDATIKAITTNSVEGLKALKR